MFDDLMANQPLLYSNILNQRSENMALNGGGDRPLPSALDARMLYEKFKYPKGPITEGVFRATLKQDPFHLRDKFQEKIIQFQYMYFVHLFSLARSLSHLFFFSLGSEFEGAKHEVLKRVRRPHFR